MEPEECSLTQVNPTNYWVDHTSPIFPLPNPAHMASALDSAPSSRSKTAYKALCELGRSLSNVPRGSTSKRWAVVFSKEASRCVSVSNSLSLLQNGEHLVCPAGGSIDLVPERAQRPPGAAEAQEQEDDTSERPWGRLAVRSVQQLLNAKHFPFPSQGHTDGEESQD